MSNFYDPAKVTLEEVISRTVGRSKDVLYGDNFKMEDHPGSTRYPGYVGYVEINISAPDSYKGHVSYDIPYDRNGVFGRAVPHD